MKVSISSKTIQKVRKMEKRTKRKKMGQIENKQQVIDVN